MVHIKSQPIAFLDEEVARPPRPAQRPEWLKVRATMGPHYQDLKTLMRDLSLHTVCEEARCPNIYECWEQRAATFMILGNVCTRRCAFCAVANGRPGGLVDWDEPHRVAHAAQYLKLRHVVITSVARDDLDDGGASVFAACIRRCREYIPECSIEVLIPDFRGSESALGTVMEANPDILNHNLETVPRLYKTVRPSAKYYRSLELLWRARQMDPLALTKCGIMVGLGETWEEILATIKDIRAADVDILTVGQYLRPTYGERHLPVVRYYTPEEFQRLREEAIAMGFRAAECGPLVRSSYHAYDQVQALKRR